MDLRDEKHASSLCLWLYLALLSHSLALSRARALSVNKPGHCACGLTRGGRRKTEVFLCSASRPLLSPSRPLPFPLSLSLLRSPCAFALLFVPNSQRGRGGESARRAGMVCGGEGRADADEQSTRRCGRICDVLQARLAAEERGRGKRQRKEAEERGRGKRQRKEAVDAPRRSNLCSSLPPSLPLPTPLALPTSLSLPPSLPPSSPPSLSPPTPLSHTITLSLARARLRLYLFSWRPLASLVSPPSSIVLSNYCCSPLLVHGSSARLRLPRAYARALVLRPPPCLPGYTCPTFL